ncbi:Uncharacterised protein [Mycobacteroides abscessus subsp. abscessus]|nr:Uncharacterised protein [Mycobacteroides abscessus subsp. abscessus]
MLSYSFWATLAHSAHVFTVLMCALITAMTESDSPDTKSLKASFQDLPSAHEPIPKSM